MFWKRNGSDRATEDRDIRRLLDAASAGEGAPSEPPPFFVSRVRARAAELAPPAHHPIGAAARQLLPGLAAVVLAVSLWTGYETVRVSQAMDAAVTEALENGAALDELLVASMIFGGTSGEGPR